MTDIEELISKLDKSKINEERHIMIIDIPENKDKQILDEVKTKYNFFFENTNKKFINRLTIMKIFKLIAISLNKKNILDGTKYWTAQSLFRYFRTKLL